MVETDEPADEKQKEIHKRKCICNTDDLLSKITGIVGPIIGDDPEGFLGKIVGIPKPLKDTEINRIRLNLFTERNSDGTGFLVLRGKDLHDRFGARITDTDIRAICLYIRESPRRITKLDLCYNKISDKGFYKLLKKILIKGRSSIIHLNIMNNNITEKSINYLANYAEFVKLKYLRINGNLFGTKGGEYLSYFLRKNDTVECLDIGQTDQTLKSLAQIITALRYDYGNNTTLKVLDLSRIVPLFDRYSYETKWLAYHIEYLLERNNNVIELRLQKNEFIGHDMEYFARALRCNKTLLYLDLGYNRIGEYGIELLAKYLAEGPQLLLLNVAGNDIKDTGARALSFGLPFSKIRALDISYNNIKQKGILDLLYTLKKPYFIRYFNIWGNEIGHQACLQIKRLIEGEVLFQQTMDIKIYEVDNVLYAAYYPSNRNKHIYYCELDFGFAQPIYHIKKNVIKVPENVIDCEDIHKKMVKTTPDDDVSN